MGAPPLNDQSLHDQLTAAMKAGDKTRVSTLRLLITELKHARVAKGEELSEEELLQVVQRQIKRRREAFEQYEKAQRSELAAKEQAEERILGEFLPPQLSSEEIGRIVEEAVARVGASGPRDKGKVMGAVMPQVRGKADGSLVGKLVDQRLSRQEQ